MNDLEIIREAFVNATTEFNECKSYCLANSSICAWSVLWVLRDQMEAARKKFISATKNALRKRQFKPTAQELENNKVFMDAFFNEASKNPDLENLFFLSPYQALETYYDAIH